MIRVRMVITPDAQIPFRRFTFGAQVISWIEFHPVVARILSDVFKWQYIEDDADAVLDQAEQQPAAFFREGSLAMAFDLFELFGCQFNAHSSFQNFSLKYLLASSARMVTMTPSSIRSATFIAATTLAADEIPTNQPSRLARRLTIACASSVLTSTASSASA